MKKLLKVIALGLATVGVWACGQSEGDANQKPPVGGAQAPTSPSGAGGAGDPAPTNSAR